MHCRFTLHFSTSFSTTRTSVPKNGTLPFRWLELRFLKGEQGLQFEVPKPHQRQREVNNAVEGLGQIVEMGDAPECQSCDSVMMRNGSCYHCMECGGTSGCS
jgi:hypothetical protein